MFDLRTKLLSEFVAALAANPALSLTNDELIARALDLAIAVEQTIASYDPLVAEQVRKDEQTADLIYQYSINQASKTSTPEENPDE
jgi:hypothetical protein